MGGGQGEDTVAGIDAGAGEGKATAETVDANEAEAKLDSAIFQSLVVLLRLSSSSGCGVAGSQPAVQVLTPKDRLQSYLEALLSEDRGYQ